MALTLDIKGEAASERLNRLDITDDYMATVLAVLQNSFDTISCIGADLLTPMRAGIIGALSAAARFAVEDNGEDEIFHTPVITREQFVEFARALWDHEYDRDGRE